jgi:nitroreductase
LTGVDVEVIKHAVQLACRAPSLHNSQPWRWEFDGSVLQLFLDRNRILYSTDRSAREALISCGAALDHLQVAMAAAGWAATVDRFPSPANADHLASIGFSSTAVVTDAQARRAQAIRERRTDRLPFASPTDWAPFELRLRTSININAVRLDVMPDEVRPELREASMLTESLRLYDSSYHTELGWWAAPYEASEGIPYSSLVSADESERVDVGRTFPVTHQPERRSEVPTDHSKIVVLSTEHDSSEDALRCGEVLSSVLLECTTAGLATCPLTHITELAASRHIVAALIGQDTTPQVLIRVGVAPSPEELPPATPRRPVDEVLITRR